MAIFYEDRVEEEQSSSLGGNEPISHTPPIAPAEFAPGPTSQYKQIEEESFFNRLAKGFQNMAAAGEGRLPFYMQLELAQRDSELKKREAELKHQNYVQSTLAFARTERQHKAAMMGEAMEVMPNAKAQILAAKPEERAALATLWGDRIDGFSPGMGEVIRRYAEDPSLGLATDLVIEENPDLQALVQTYGYPEVIKMEKFKESKERLGRDSFNAIAGRMDFKAQLAMSKKDGLTEDEFRADFKKIAMEAGRDATDPTKGLSLRKQAFAYEFLSTPTGQALMANAGVKLSKSALTSQEKEAGATFESRQKQTEVEQINAQLAEMDKVEQEYTPKDIAGQAEKRSQLEHRRDLLLGILKLEPRGGAAGAQKMTQRTSEALFDISGGKFNSFQSLMESDLPQAEQADLMKRALQKVGQIYPQGKVDVTQASPFPVGKEELYKVSDLVAGRLQRSLAPISVSKAVSGGEYVNLDKDQLKSLQSLQEAKGTSEILFGMARKLFTAGTQVDVAKQAAWYYTTGYLSTEAKTYRDIITGWSTIYARALGREVGVLTDRDVSRWTSIMPMPSDSKHVVQRKVEVMEKFISFLNETTTKVIAGQFQPNLAYQKGKHRDTIDGFLGRLEKIHSDGGGESKSGIRSMSKAEELRERMLKGK